jgi:CRP-like cAMP-binding protein
VPQTKPASRNILLASLSPSDLALISGALTHVDLPRRMHLEWRGRPIENVFFPESGIASVVADGASGGVEVGMIGREGMTGIDVLLSVDRAPNDVYMQVSGDGLRAPAAVVRDAAEQSASFRHLFLAYVHAFHQQASQTALSNARNKLEERLARWLLLAHDRLEGDALPLTHEFLSIMIGVRRAGVTIAINDLESKGLIDARRGAIVILDRDGLIEESNGAYGEPDHAVGRSLS